MHRLTQTQDALYKKENKMGITEKHCHKDISQAGPDLVLARYRLVLTQDALWKKQRKWESQKKTPLQGHFPGQH